jgi:hypothetical protein
MTSLKSQFQNCPDLSSLKNRRVLSVSLASSYIANGRIVNTDQLEVWVLDNSEIAETLRSEPAVDFEVSLCEGMCLQGKALAELGVSRTGHNKKRYIEVILTLQDACEVLVESAASRWLT